VDQGAGRRSGTLTNLDPGMPMRPAAVVEAYWQIFQEPRDAWSLEREIGPLRKDGEAWSMSNSTSILAAPTPIWRIW
jgi:hypothetical protein